MNNKQLFFFLFISFIFASCDSGDIYPEEDTGNSRLVSASFVLKNTSTIPVDKERKLVFAAFSDESSLKPIRITRISEAEEGKKMTINLTKTSLSATKVALVIADQSSEVITYLFEQALPEGTGDVEFDGGTIDLASYHRVQHQLFNLSCVSCHSELNPSGSLNLEKGASYDQLVNKQSYKYDDLLVEPGYVSRSLIVNKLTDYAVGTFHTTLSSMKEEDIDLLRRWIENGAMNN